MKFYRKRSTDMLTLLLETVTHMVDVYNAEVLPGEMIKILVLPNTDDGKLVYDFAVDQLGEVD